MTEDIAFEEMLFLRIAYEYTKMYKIDRTAEYLEYLDKITLSFEDYSHIFNTLLTAEIQDRILIQSEWLKFSLSLPIEDEVTRRNLVSLMFEYIGHVENSYRDYQHMLKYQRYLIKEQDIRSVDLALEMNIDLDNDDYTNN